MTMTRSNALLFLLLASLACSLSTAIKCYAGSRGPVNGEMLELFHEEECEEDMTYCIESFNSDFEEVTASCQRYGTNTNLMAICKSGKEQTKNGLTIRCCTKDLCNKRGKDKKTTKKSFVEI